MSKVGGKYARNKGAREERGLVMHLNEMGYQNVRRVPLSGAAKGFKFDVYADMDGVMHTFEMKSTSTKRFDWIYKFYECSPHRNLDSVVRVAVPGGQVALGYDPRLVGRVGFDCGFATMEETRHTKRLIKYALELKKDAEFLVLKANQKRRLYLKYWL
jgi:hypothetical protein